MVVMDVLLSWSIFQWLGTQLLVFFRTDPLCPLASAWRMSRDELSFESKLNAFVSSAQA